MLSFNRFLNTITTITLEGALSATTNQETGDTFCIFSGTWKAFDSAKEQILRYLKSHPGVPAIWVVVDDNYNFVNRQMPFVIQWVGLCSDGHYEVEVQGQWSNRIAQKWSSVLAKTLGGNVTLFWTHQGGEND